MAFAALAAKLFALTTAQVPGFVAADVEEPAGKVRQQFIVEFAQEGQGAGMIRRERGGTTDKFAAGVLVGFGNFGEFLQWRMFKKESQVAEGVLIRHEVNAKFATARIELADFLASQCAPALPDEFVVAIGERMLGVKLQLVDFEIGEMFREVEERFQLWHAPARNVQHHSTARKIRPVTDFQAWQAATVLSQQLPQGCRCSAQAASLSEGNLNSCFGNRQRVAFRMIWLGICPDNLDCGKRFPFRQRERAAKDFQQARAGEQVQFIYPATEIYLLRAATEFPLLHK